MRFVSMSGAMSLRLMMGDLGFSVGAASRWYPMRGSHSSASSQRVTVSMNSTLVEERYWEMASGSLLRMARAMRSSRQGFPGPQGSGIVESDGDTAR